MVFGRISYLIPYLSLVMAMSLWASSFIALKIAFQHFHPMVVIFGRMLVGSLCFVMVPGVVRSLRFDRQDWKLIGFMVLFEPCLYFLLEAKALELTTASQAGMITSLMPLMVSLVAFFTLRERLSQTTIIGLVISVVGACWLSLGGDPTPDASNPPLGNLCELAAMVCAAGYTILLKKLTQKGYSPFNLTAMQAFFGSLFYFPILFLPGVNLPVDFDLVPILTIVYLGSFITLGAYGCFNYGVSKIAAGQASIFINLIPVLTLAMGMIILGERLTMEQFFACGVIFSGIFLSQMGEWQAARA